MARREALRRPAALEPRRRRAGRGRRRRPSCDRSPTRARSPRGRSRRAASASGTAEMMTTAADERRDDECPRRSPSPTNDSASQSGVRCSASHSTGRASADSNPSEREDPRRERQSDEDRRGREREVADDEPGDEDRDRMPVREPSPMRSRRPSGVAPRAQGCGSCARLAPSPEARAVVVHQPDAFTCIRCFPRSGRGKP